MHVMMTINMAIVMTKDTTSGLYTDMGTITNINLRETRCNLSLITISS